MSEVIKRRGMMKKRMTKRGRIGSREFLSCVLITMNNKLDQKEEGERKISVITPKQSY